MTSYFIPDINATSRTLPKENLFSYTFIFHNQFCYALSGLKIIFHGNTDNNLESSCITLFFSGVGLSPLGTAATSGLLYKLQMIDEGDCGAID
jgi:hypothetical protein